MGTKTFSDQIRDAVDRSGMSRYRICAEIKLSQSTMSRFMAGETGLRLDVLDRLAVLLGLTVVVKKPKRKGK
jgi:ribosome-binding protein aMBF1 (putative translation factor)